MSILLAAAFLTFADWRTEYAGGLDSARRGDWSSARAAFLRANALRPGDVSGGTSLPGPITERREWRDGAPYSPRFLAAYSAYTLARTPSTQDKPASLSQAALELDALAKEGKFGVAGAYILGEVYSLQGDLAKRDALKNQKYDLKWREDLEVVAPEHVVVIQSGENRPLVIPAEQLPENQNKRPITSPPAIVRPNEGVPKVDLLPAPIVGGVPQRGDKFALIVGNAESRLPNQGIPFAVDDSMAIREELINYGGYTASNIETAMNSTAGQMRAAAKLLAGRAPEGATILIYFTGAGANVAGKDYLAGVDTPATSDTATMLAKDELLKEFAKSGNKVFAFFQTPRVTTDGRAFGSEFSPIGGVSVAQATTAGEGIQSVDKAGRKIGVYTDAFISTIREMRTNQIPINEFGWRVFQRLRDSGSTQVPSLPVLSQLPSNAKF